MFSNNEPSVSLTGKRLNSEKSAPLPKTEARPTSDPNLLRDKQRNHGASRKINSNLFEKLTTRVEKKEKHAGKRVVSLRKSRPSN